MTKLVSKCKERLANARKNNKGFTLVELIVVIVILAILIGVTIGGVMQYVGQSRENTDINNASSMQSVLSTIGVDEDVYKMIGKDSSKPTFTLEWTEAATDIPDKDITVNGKTLALDEMLEGLVELPKSQTGEGFRMIISSDGEGDVKVKVIAICNSATEGDSTSQTTPAWITTADPDDD